MSLRLLAAVLLAESRGARGRLLFVAACLAVGVAAVSGVAALSQALESGLAANSRALLGADLAAESRRQLPEDLDAVALETWRAGRPDPGPGAPRTARVVKLDTMIAAADERAASAPRSQLTALKVVTPGWPLYGELELDPPLSAAELGDAQVAVAPELLASLGLALGDPVRIGGARYTLAAVVRDEPDEVELTFQVGPRVLMLDAGFARTELLGFGSRVRYRGLFAFPGPPGAGELRALARSLAARLDADAGDLRLRTHDRAQPALRRGMDRVGRYLGLVALLSLVLGGTGVAQVVRAWLAERTPSIAVLRAMGWRPREVLVLYVAHVGLLAFVASLAGALAGALLPLAVTRLAPELLPAELLRLWQPLAVARGVALGVGIAVFFALRPLLAVWTISPARVLRAEAEPLEVPRTLATAALLALAGAVFLAAWWQGDSLRDAAWFTAGLAALTGLLLLASRGLARLARAAPRAHLPPTLVHGVAALGRPSSGTSGALVALGLGVLVVVAMQLVRGRLADELSGALPPEAPSAFLLDVQPDQWEGVRAVLDEEGAAHVDWVPVLTARLSAIDGVPVAELLEGRGARGRERWVLTREQRLTWREGLEQDNQLVAGALWGQPGVDEVSLEEDFAADLGATLGTRLAFDVQGVPVELTVTSLRRVEWRSFRINFFVVVEPGVLDAAPHMLLAAARIDPPAEDLAQGRVVAAYPNVTYVRVRAILERVAAVFARLSLAVGSLGWLTIVAGLAILAGVAATSAARRGREVALLKTLGVTRAGVAGLLFAEFALSGLVAGALGAAFAWALAHAFLSIALELEPRLPLWVPPAAALGSALLAAAAGLVASLRALAMPPIATLRGA